VGGPGSVGILNLQTPGCEDACSDDQAYQYPREYASAEFHVVHLMNSNIFFTSKMHLISQKE
jgi:hypothetical protein